ASTAVSCSDFSIPLRSSIARATSFTARTFASSFFAMICAALLARHHARPRHRAHRAVDLPLERRRLRLLVGKIRLRLVLRLDHLHQILVPLEEHRERRVHGPHVDLLRRRDDRGPRLYANLRTLMRDIPASHL